jgi:hypothetical protein
MPTPRLAAAALAGLRVRPETEREVEIAMREFLAFSLDRKPRSLAFLDEVRAEERLAQPALARP